MGEETMPRDDLDNEVARGHNAWIESQLQPNCGAARVIAAVAAKKK